MSSRSPRTPTTLAFYSQSAARSNSSPDFEPTLTDSEFKKYDDCENNLELQKLLQSKNENHGPLGIEIVNQTDSPGARDECGDYSLRGREIALHIAVMEAKLSDEIKSKNKLLSVLSDYEKQISENDREIEILKLEKQEIELECEGFKEQLEISSKHLNNIEISFNDVHEKYERAKQTIQILNKNVETLKESIAEHDLCISKKHEQFLKLKEHAMERMDFANSQLDLMERKYSLETSKLRASLREAELGARSLSQHLEQRNRDNAELSSICDGLIERMDLQKNNNTVTSDAAAAAVDQDRGLNSYGGIFENFEF